MPSHRGIAFVTTIESEDVSTLSRWWCTSM